MAELIVELPIPLRLLMLFKPAVGIPGTAECPILEAIDEIELGAENMDWVVSGLIELKKVKFFVDKGAGVSPLFVQLLYVYAGYMSSYGCMRPLNCGR